MRIRGFIGPSYADISRPVDAQASINLFPERVESGAREAILRRVPGRRAIASALENKGRGCFAQDGRCFWVFGTILYELMDGGAYTVLQSMTLRGTVVNDTRRVAFASNGQGGNQLFIVSGGHRYILHLLTNVFEEVGGGFTTLARGASYLNGTFYTTSGIFIYASALEDGTSWAGDAKFQRSAASDDLVDLILDDHKVMWAIGSKTSEPLYDAGLTPMPLQPIENSLLGYGTGSPDTPIRFDSTVFFVAQNETGDRLGVVISGGQSAKRISTHAIEQDWRTYATVEDAFTWTYSEAGHAFVVVTFPTPGKSWAYDAATGAWHQMGNWPDLIGTEFVADVAACHCFAFGRHLVGTSNTGLVLEQSMSLSSSDGFTPIRWVRRSPHFESPDRSWVRCAAFELLAEKGSGISYELAANRLLGTEALVNLRYSDDGGYTWSSYRTRSLGANGQRDLRARWRLLGRFVDRVWEVSGSDPAVTVLIDALFEGG